MSQPTPPEGSEYFTYNPKTGKVSTPNTIPSEALAAVAHAAEMQQSIIRKVAELALGERDSMGLTPEELAYLQTILSDNGSDYGNPTPP